MSAIVRPAKVSRQSMKVVVSLGLMLQINEWLRLDMKMLSRHICIFGGTGGGKTSAALHLMQQLTGYGVGYTFVTPHPDGRKRLLEHCIANNIPPDRIVDLEITPECCASIDPFANRPENANEETWLRARVGLLVGAFLRNVPKAEQEVMNRLKRWLKNVLYCCGKRVDGEYVGIGKALVLLDPDHPEFDGIMDRLWLHLPDFIRSDFRMLQGIKSPERRQQLVESTINRLREVVFDSPLVTQMLSKSDHAVDFEQVILQSMTLLVAVPESDDLSRDQGNVVAGIVISLMMGAARRIGSRVPEHLRVFHMLIIDEAENFIGTDLQTGFQELRKFRMIIVIIVQEMTGLLKGEMDLLPKVISQCGIQMTFQQQDPDALEYLGKAFAYCCLRIKPLMMLQVLPGGHRIIQLEGYSFSATGGVSVTQAHSRTQSRSVSDTQTDGESASRSISRALSETSSNGGSEGENEASNWSVGCGTTRNETESRSLSHGKNRTRSVSDARSLQQTQSTTEGESEQDTRSESEAASSTTTSSSGSSSARNESHTQSDSHTRGLARSEALHGDHNRGENRSDNRGHTNGHSAGNSTSQTSTTGESRGNTKTHAASTSRGHSKSVSAGRSEGETHTVAASEGESEQETTARSGGSGASESQSLGGSKGRNTGRNWTDSSGRTVTNGETASQSASRARGQTEGTAEGRTDGQSTSQSSGVTYSISQTALPIQTLIQVPSGKLEEAVSDQVYGFVDQIASLQDRIVLMKVKGMRQPFILRVHNLEDPYKRRGLLRCAAWRELELKKYVAAIRKASPHYFLPSFDMGAADAPVIVETPKPKARPRHPELVAVDDDPMG